MYRGHSLRKSMPPFAQPYESNKSLFRVRSDTGERTVFAPPPRIVLFEVSNPIALRHIGLKWQYLHGGTRVY